MIPQRLSLQLLLGVPAILYLAIALLWQSSGFYRITGDEPHYLLIADSLVRDNDLMVANNYSLATQVSAAIGGGWPGTADYTHLHNGFSIHGVGLPVICAVPYYVAGVGGVKIFLALLAGLLPFLFYRAIYPVADSEEWAALLSFVLAIGLPFSAASNQIYPDLLAGMIIIYVTTNIAGMKVGRRTALSQAATIRDALLIAFLPWLHIRLTAPALILLLAYIYALRTAQSPKVHIAGWRSLAVLVAAVVFSLMLLGIYNYVAFGGVWGIYPSNSFSFAIEEFGMVFMGLHWDQLQGMFMLQPLLLLGLAGIVPMVRANWRAALLFGALYLSVLLPNAMHPNWYGGDSMAGRFAWSVVSLWVFPLAYALRLLLDLNKKIVLSLYAASIALQVIVASMWLSQNYLLISRNVGDPLWASGGLGKDLLTPELWLRLPHFMQFDRYLFHLPNYACLLVSLALLLSGWLYLRRKVHLIAATWIAVLLLGVWIVMRYQPSLDLLSVQGEQMASRTGTIDGTYRVARGSRGDKAGPLVFTAPQHISLSNGEYEVALEYRYEPGGDVAEHMASVRVVVDPLDPRIQPVIIVGGALPPSATNDGLSRYKFSVNARILHGRFFGVVVWYPGYGDLEVKRMTVVPLALTY